MANGKPIPKSKKLPKIGKLQKEADTLMQEVGKLMFPKSLISGKPTQVMHHFRPKSVSARLRYEWDNLIPLTNAEHYRLHQSPGPDIEIQIVKAKGGTEWYDQICALGRKEIKVNREYYLNVIEKLENKKQRLS